MRATAAACRDTERQRDVTAARLSKDRHALDLDRAVWASPAHWGIGTKVVALAVTSVAVTGIGMGGVSAWQSGRFADDAQTDVAALVEEDISRTATGVYDVVSTQGALDGRGGLRPRRRALRPGPGRQVQASTAIPGRHRSPGRRRTSSRAR